MEYDNVYVMVCFSGHWEYRTRKNLQTHLQFVNQYSIFHNRKVLFIVSQRGLDSSVSEEINSILQQDKSSNVDTVLLTSMNWGMTVAALWDAWKYCKQKQVVAKYLSCTDDDWLFNHWKAREELIEQEQLVGCGVFTVMQNNPDYIVWFKQGYKEVKVQEPGWAPVLKELNAPNLRWTDGAFYYMSYPTLAQIEAKMGCFTKAPQEEITRENDGYGIHGIRYGEIGFPTSLYGYGFKFKAYTGSSIIVGTYIFDQSVMSIGSEVPKGFVEDTFEHPSSKG